MVAAFGLGFRVSVLTDGRVMRQLLEAIPGRWARPEITKRAKAMGLRAPWAEFDGIVARQVCWPGGALRRRPAGGWGAGTGSEGRPVRGDLMEVGHGPGVERGCLLECPAAECSTHLRAHHPNKGERV